MKQRLPGIYTNGNCRLCHTVKEDNVHMWSCRKAKAKRESIILNKIIANIEKHLAQTDQIGFNNNRATIRKAIECINALRLQDHNPYVTGIALTKLYTKAYGFANETEIEELLIQGELIQFHHLCRGFAPEALSQLLKILTLSVQQNHEGIDRTSQKTRSFKAADKLFNTLLEDTIKTAKEEIWKSRCDTTIAWEKVHRITKQIKTNKRARAEFELDEEPDGENDGMNQAPDRNTTRIPVRVDGDNTDDEEELTHNTKHDKKKRKIANLEHTAGFHELVLAGKVPIHRLVNPSKKGNMKGR